MVKKVDVLLKRSFDWRSKYQDTGETCEEALVRLYNDPSFIGELRHSNDSFCGLLAAQFGVSRMSISKKLGRLRKKGKLKSYIESTQARVVLPDKKFPGEDLPERLLKLIIDGNKLINEHDVRQEEVFPYSNWLNWVGLVVGGDWHLDHYRTDAQGIVDDLKLIGGVKNLFYGFNGDMVDVLNMRFIELENETLNLPIRYLYDIVEKLFSYVPNTLFAVCGCHDNWVRTRARYDIIEGIQKKIFGYYLGFGGTVNWKLGDVTYRIASQHKFGNESKYNHFHPCYNYLHRIDAKADIVCVSHRHDIVGICQVYVQGEPRVFMRSGSRQYKTNYAWKEGFTGAVSRYPMVLLNGTEKRMISVCNFKEGIVLLEMLNKYPNDGLELLRAGGGSVYPATKVLKELGCEQEVGKG